MTLQLSSAAAWRFRARASVSLASLLRQARTDRVTDAHPGLTVATSVLFRPDALRFDSGLTDIALGVPARSLMVDARAELLGPTRGLRGTVRTRGEPRGLEQLILIDAGQPYRVAFPRERAPAIDFVYVAPRLLLDTASDIVEAPVATLSLRSDLRLVDGGLRATARQYIEALHAPQVDRLWLDSLRHLLAAHLVVRHTAGLPARRARVGPLALPSLRRVDDFLRAHLATQVRLADLAVIAGLSPHHFLRSFRRATGRTPHQYLLQRRVEEAAHLLRTTDLPIVDVAGAAGFANQSHLSRAFRRHFGTTPGRFRADRTA